MTKADRIAGAIDGALDRVERVLIGGLVTLALALGTMQVVLRYVFNTGFEWNEAVFVLCTVSAMLMAGSRAVREKVNQLTDEQRAAWVAAMKPVWEEFGTKLVGDEVMMRLTQISAGK